MKNQEEFPSLRESNDQEVQEICTRLRGRLLDVVSRSGGHLASNLGAVELTVALHRVFDFTRDRLVFDVGHQCYIHKMLTGRNTEMETLRTFGGVSGFPKPAESPCDAFIAGHASNAVSVALGMAIARSRQKETYQVIALLGDGALTGGLAYEGLSCAGQSGEPLIIILNDNGMSITKNVGGVAQHLARQRLKPQYLSFKKWYRSFMNATGVGRRVYRCTHSLKEVIKGSILPCSMFEDMGFHYIGPVDGHDVKGLTRLLGYARDLSKPVLLHVRTVKGKGYPPAERNPDEFHGVAPFHISDGSPKQESTGNSFSSVFGETLCRLAQQDTRICAITAAMQPGTGLNLFAMEFRERFFDVGIAEGHAVTMAAGMAKQGIIPVFAVYASFFQRSYDMLIHDVAIQHLHVVFCVDRAGLVGEDGETHHGLFDTAFLHTIPGMTVFCPASERELSEMLNTAIHHIDGPVALRYPRGGEGTYKAEWNGSPSISLRTGSDLTLVTHGTMVNEVIQAAELLYQNGIEATVIKLNTITPLPTEQIMESVRKTGRILIAEESLAMGSVGERILAQLAEQVVPIRGVALCNCGTTFVPQGSVTQLRKLCGLDANSIFEKSREMFKYGK